MRVSTTLQLYLIFLAIYSTARAAWYWRCRLDRYQFGGLQVFLRNDCFPCGLVSFPLRREGQLDKDDKSHLEGTHGKPAGRKNMKRTLLFTVTIAATSLLIGLFIGVGLAQQKRVTLVDLSATRADLTQLDFILLKAELSEIRDTTSVSDIGWPAYAYHRSSNKLFVSVYVDPDWWAKTDAITLKDRLQNKGVNSCLKPFLEEPTLSYLAEKDRKNTNCEANFYTLAKGARSLDVATYYFDRSELVLR